VSCDWEYITLGELSTITAGGVTPKSKGAFAGGTHPFFRTSDIGQIRFGEILEARDTLNDDGVRGLRRFPKGTIVIPKSGASTFLDYRVMLGVEGYVSSTLAAIIPDASRVNRRWLLYYLSTVSARDLTVEQMYPSLRLPDVAGIPVRMPPLPEQQRIVAILDEAFRDIAIARRDAEKNLGNARSAMRSYIESLLSQCNVASEEATIADVCTIGDGNHSSNYPRKDELVEAGVPFIRATNLVDGRIWGEGMRFLSPEKHAQLKKGHLKAGDVLVTNRGEIGRTAIVDSAYDNSNLNSQIAWLRCSERMDYRFLFYVLNSDEVQRQFASSTSGTALQQFTIRQLKSVRVPVLQIDVQRAIVAQLSRFSAETQLLEDLCRRKLDALDDLKCAFLHHALDGQLRDAT